MTSAFALIAFCQTTFSGSEKLMVASWNRRNKSPSRVSGDFYGYLWQGKDEGVVVNALEWIFSYGGGSIIEIG